MQDALTEVVRAAGTRPAARQRGGGGIADDDQDDDDDTSGGDQEAQWTVHRATIDLGGLSTWTEPAA